MTRYSEREQDVIEFLQRRSDYCAQKVERYGENKEYTAQREWAMRRWECEHILGEIMNILRAPIKEYIIKDGVIQNGRTDNTGRTVN